MRLGKIANRERSVGGFVPYSHHVNDTTIKTKSGLLLNVIKLEGIPFETVDQIDLNIKKNIRATMLRGLSNSRFAVYHHIIRRQVSKFLDGTFENNWCDALDKAYQAKLSKKKMFINEQYITIVRRPAQSHIGLIAEITGSLFTKVDKNIASAKQTENLKALEDAVSNVLTTLSPYKPKLLGIKETDNGTCSEILSFLSYLINLENSDILLPEMSLADYLPQKRISFGPESFEVRGAASKDIKIGGVLSIKEYANATAPGMLDALLRLPHEFILTQSFGFVDRQTSLSAMNEAQRKMIAAQQGSESLIAGIEDARDDLTSGHASFGEHHLSITLFGKNKKTLDQAISDCTGSFINLGIVSVREDVNLEASFWANLPGNFSYIARRSLISDKNFASFASLHAFPAGRQCSNHWGSAITKLETTSGTPYWFNFHERDVGNFTLIGPTGTGKTVLLTFLLAQTQRLNPKSVYFDKDRGAEIFIRAIGGDYTVVKSGHPTGLNPLLLSDTPENKSFLREWLKLLITSDGGHPLSPPEIEIVSDAINANYEADPAHRRLSYLSELLAGYKTQSEINLSQRIARWHGNGELAWLFDNASDTLSLNNKTIGFDLTSILDDPICRAPWLMYIFHRVNALLDGQKTILLLDEGWKMLDDQVFSARIKDWMKTIRKQNGIIGFATQSARDALNSNVGETIIEQSPTQIFLPNAKATKKDYCGGFGLSLRELKIIRELAPESRCFLIKHGSDSVIARLDLSGMESFISVLSGRSETVALLEDIRKQHGDTPDEWLKAFERKVAA